MKVIHKISPVLILAGYFYVFIRSYFLCQFGGVRYHGQKMAVGAAVMAVGFLFWLITRKKAKEQQAGKKQYLWIAELVAAGAATIICGAAVIRTAIPYNGALSWKIDEWRRIIDESSSNANSDINNEETSRQFPMKQRQKRKPRPAGISAIRIRGSLMQKTAICIISSMILPVTG